MDPMGNGKGFQAVPKNSGGSVLKKKVDSKSDLWQVLRSLRMLGGVDEHR